MNLNYTRLHTGSHDQTVNYYITHLLYEVVSDTGCEPLDIALRSSSWDWDKWFYVPEDMLVKLDDSRLEKLRAGVTAGLLQLVDTYEDLLTYLRWMTQDRALVDYIQFVPKPYGILVYYPHVAGR